MKNDFLLDFISKEDFEKHIKNTIDEYDKTLNSIDLEKFNENLIDPIKLTFDKAIYDKDWSDIIDMEIARQRDKTNSNIIGYFHQNIFKYIKNCVVPDKGFDIIYTNDNNTKICVELKNKHNTMNSSSSKSTYLKMKEYINNNPNDQCFLVEVIAPLSRNIVWNYSHDGIQEYDERIRRVSIDQFYYLITGEENAFYLLCSQLNKTLDEMITQKQVKKIEDDTVKDELKLNQNDIERALYMLAFERYLGFDIYEK